MHTSSMPLTLEAKTSNNKPGKTLLALNVVRITNCASRCALIYVLMVKFMSNISNASTTQVHTEYKRNTYHE